jgi:hypothetical protein
MDAANSADLPALLDGVAQHISAATGREVNFSSRGFVGAMTAASSSSGRGRRSRRRRSVGHENDGNEDDQLGGDLRFVPADYYGDDAVVEVDDEAFLEALAAGQVDSEDAEEMAAAAAATGGTHIRFRDDDDEEGEDEGEDEDDVDGDGDDALIGHRGDPSSSHDDDGEADGNDLHGFPIGEEPEEEEQDDELEHVGESTEDELGDESGQDEGRWRHPATLTDEDAPSGSDDEEAGAAEDLLIDADEDEMGDDIAHAVGMSGGASSSIGRGRHSSRERGGSRAAGANEADEDLRGISPSGEDAGGHGVGPHWWAGLDAPDNGEWE